MIARLEDEFGLLVQHEEWEALKSWMMNRHAEYLDYGIIDKNILFNYFFLSHYFKETSSPWQYKLLKRLHSKNNEVIVWPRGHAKTTNMQGCEIFRICNGWDNFTVVIEKTFTEAAEVLQSIYNEFKDNQKILAVYGDLIDRNKEEEYQAKNRDAYGDKFIANTRLRALGFNKNIRGIKTRQYRPDRIIMDDVEDDVHINSQEQRAKYEANYTRAIVPALATGGVIKVMGTILHQDSLLNNLAKQQGTPIYKAFYTPEMDKLYHEVRLPEIEIKEPQIFAKTKAKLLWPDMWSWETLMKKRQDMIINENRTDNAFFQEYRNEPIAEEERAFKFDWLWNPNRIMPLDSLLKSGKEYRVFAMIDLGESTSETADPTAAIVLFVDHDGNWYPVSVRNERRNVTAQIDLIFELWTLWSPFGLEVIGVERKAFDDQIKPLIYEESNRRNAYPLVQELKHLGKEKYVRILGSLQGRYERGKVWTVVDSKGMPIEQTEILKKQLYDLGKTKYDDLADTLAYGSQLVDRPTMGDDLLANNEPSDDPYNI